MSKKTKLYEGTGKILYPTDNEREIIIKFKDDAPAQTGGKKGKIKGKGEVKNAISTHLFTYLASYNIPTHFIEQVSNTEMKVKKVDIIRIKFVMHNIAAGNLSKQYGLEEGADLKTPILEFYLKDDKRDGPLLNEYHAYEMNLATREEIRAVSRQTLKINAVLRPYFQRRGLLLADYTLEFGRFDDALLLADEISPDNCTFWDADTRKKIETGTGGRKDLAKLETVYSGILERILA